MIHIRLKPTTQINASFSLSKAIEDIVIPEVSKNKAQKYIENRKLAEEDDFDIMMVFENSIIYGFDYIYNGKKLVLPELNPVTMFYSNALMSYGMLNHYKDIFLNKSSVVGNYRKTLDYNHFGFFFPLAVNCIINLQATVESFINNIVIGKYDFKNKNEKPRNANIYEKMEKAIPALMKKKFHVSFCKEYELIKELIKLRNGIIHIKPDQAITNSRYKIPFRQIIDFNYYQILIAVKNYVNFYEPNLIEECSCGKQFFFDYCEKQNK